CLLHSFPTRRSSDLPIPITFVILADNPNDLSLKKRLVSEVFNPKHGLGKMTYNFYGREYEIEAGSEHVPSFPSGVSNRGVTYQRSEEHTSELQSRFD